MVTKIRYAFGETSPESLALGLVYAFSLIVSAILSSVFLAKTRRTHLFTVWIIFGVLASICSAASLGSSLFVSAFAVSLLGVSTGVGLPSCLSYFAESFSIENRGKVGGIILFTAFFGSATAMIFIVNLNLVYHAAFLAIWRAWTLPFTFLVAKKQPVYDADIRTAPSLTSIVRNKSFALYFIAWMMFAFVNSFEGVVVNLTLGDYRFFIKVVEPTVAGFSALIAGTLSDWVGRKRVLISGFVFLGIAYATIGLLFQSWISWLFYFFMDGVAIGSLWVLFVIVLWGDFSRNGSEKIYALGEAPFFLTEILYLLLAPYLALVPAAGIFSLAAFFLFLAVLPLLYAPETLPEKKIKERELKMYIGEAKKIREKYT
jgi:MFS family permease